MAVEVLGVGVEEETEAAEMVGAPAAEKVEVVRAEAKVVAKAAGARGRRGRG